MSERRRIGLPEMIDSTRLRRGVNRGFHARRDRTIRGMVNRHRERGEAAIVD
jgi:hypothetical protein